MYDERIHCFLYIWDTGIISICFLFRVLHFWGQMSNSPRKESTVYPKVVTELADFAVTDLAAGSNCIVVVAHRRNAGKSASLDGWSSERSQCIAWGVPVAGKFGYGDGARTSSAPRVVDGAIADSTVVQNISAVSCGYGHVCYIVNSVSPATASDNSAGAGASDSASSNSILGSDKNDKIDKKRRSSESGENIVPSSTFSRTADSSANKKQKKRNFEENEVKLHAKAIAVTAATDAVRTLSSVFPVLEK